jgi:hypothetical protein
MKHKVTFKIKTPDFHRHAEDVLRAGCRAAYPEESDMSSINRERFIMGTMSNFDRIGFSLRNPEEQPLSQLRETRFGLMKRDGNHHLFLYPNLGRGMGSERELPKDSPYLRNHYAAVDAVRHTLKEHGVDFEEEVE